MWLAQILRGPDFPCDDSQTINQVKLRSTFIVSFCLYSLPSGAPTATRHLSWRLDLVLLSTVGFLPELSKNFFINSGSLSFISLQRSLLCLKISSYPFPDLSSSVSPADFTPTLLQPISQPFSCVLLHNCTTICCICIVYLFHSNTPVFWLLHSHYHSSHWASHWAPWTRD